MGRKPSTAKKDDAGRVPKRAKSSFFFFSDSCRESLKAKHPSANMAELSKKLSERWKALSEDDREPFKELAMRDKLRVEKAQIEAGTYKVSKRSTLPSRGIKLPAGWRKNYDHSLQHDIYVHTATKTVIFVVPTSENVPVDLLVPPPPRVQTPFQLFCKKHSKEAKGGTRKEKLDYLKKMFEASPQDGEDKDSFGFDF